VVFAVLDLLATGQQELEAPRCIAEARPLQRSAVSASRRLAITRLEARAALLGLSGAPHQVFRLAAAYTGQTRLLSAGGVKRPRLIWPENTPTGQIPLQRVSDMY